MELDLLPGESREYWKYHAPTKWFGQAKASGKINNDRANLLFDTGAEISILDIAFARKVGCQIDESERQGSVGIVYTTEERTRIKVTLNGNLVYIFKVWVGPMMGQDAILGMDFMVSAGIRLDLADGTLCLLDKVRVQLAGRRTFYDNQVSDVKLGRCVQIPTGGYKEVPLKRSTSHQCKLWVTRQEWWVTTVNQGVGSRKFLKVINDSTQPLILHKDAKIGMWLINDQVSRAQCFVSVRSQRYAEWLNLMYESTTNQVDYQVDLTREDGEPLVETPQYDIPSGLLQRPRVPAPVMNMSFQQKINQIYQVNPRVDQVDHQVDSTKNDEGPTVETPRYGVSSGTAQFYALFSISSRFFNSYISNNTDWRYWWTTIVHELKPFIHTSSVMTMSPRSRPNKVDQTKKGEGPLVETPQADDQVCTFERGELWAEDVSQEWAIIPEVDLSHKSIKLEDIQIPDPDGNSLEEVDRLRQSI